MNYEIFSQRLKDARNKKNLTQKQLAEKIGVSATTLTNYETNKSKVPGADTLVLLADALDVSIDWLLGNEKHIETSSSPNKNLNFIKSEDIKEALSVLFAAFEGKVNLVDYNVQKQYYTDSGYPETYSVALKGIIIDEENIQKYLRNYEKLLSVDIDKAVLKSVFDAIFPKGQFIMFTHSFEYYESPSENEFFGFSEG